MKFLAVVLFLFGFEPAFAGLRLCRDSHNDKRITGEHIGIEFVPGKGGSLIIDSNALQPAFLGFVFNEAWRVQFQSIQSKNRAFSLRAYAKRLGVHSGVLSSILRGSRHVSPKYAHRLLKRMSLPPDQEESLRASIEFGITKKSDLRPARRTLELRSDEFHLISNGIHYAVLCLLEMEGARSDVEWMASRLTTTPAQVRKAVDRLIRLGLIVVRGRRWTLTGVQLTTSDGIRDSAIQKYHEDRLEEARLKLHEVPVDKRYFSSTTMAIQAAKLPEARQLINDFTRKMEELLEQNPRDEVYRIGVQLYPITERKE